MNCGYEIRFSGSDERSQIGADPRGRPGWLVYCGAVHLSLVLRDLKTVLFPMLMCLPSAPCDPARLRSQACDCSRLRTSESFNARRLEG